MSYQLRPAQKNDHNALHQFIHAQNYLHRHLDWRDALDWLGCQPFYLLENQNKVCGVLSCPAEPPSVAWVRLFGVAMNLSPDKAWNVMFERAQAVLKNNTPCPALVSLGLKEWFSALLQRNGFSFHQDIVVFVYDEAPPPAPEIDDEILLREMRLDDLAQVLKLDNAAFEHIWQLSPNDLENAYHRSAYNTVAEIDGEIIAYQMSSSTGFYAHLARLAVKPNLQRRRIGYAVVQDLLEHFIKKRACWGVTLNTQHDNTSSIALYHKIGFRETGERFPVYVYPL